MLLINHPDFFDMPHITLCLCKLMYGGMPPFGGLPPKWVANEDVKLSPGTDGFTSLPKSTVKTPRFWAELSTLQGRENNIPATTTRPQVTPCMTVCWC